MRSLAVGPKDIIQDNNSGLQFLVDTGAQVSVIPATLQDKQQNIQGVPLLAANGTSISTYGKRRMSLKLGRHVYEAHLILADVQRPLLGADFLRTHDLLGEIRGKRLVQAETLCPISCAINTRHHLNLATVDENANKFKKVIQEFSALIRPTFSSAQVENNTKILSRPLVHLFSPKPDDWHLASLEPQGKNFPI